MGRVKLPPRDWFLVLITVVILYLGLNFGLPKIIKGFAATYVIRPAAWGLLALYIFRLPKYKSAVKPRLRGTVIKIALALAVFQIYFFVVAGFLNQFGKSPNSFTITGITVNLIFVTSGLLGMELSRAWLINRLGGKRFAFWTAFIAMFYTCLNLPLNKIPHLSSGLENITKFLGSDLLPVFMENLVASYLAFWAGPASAVVYRGILQGFEWFSPVLPVLNWAMKALTGTVVPVLGLVMAYQFLLYKEYPGKARRVEARGLLSWVILSVVAVVAVWFAAGVFPVRPTVIISGSMRPAMEVGDIAIVAEINPEALQEGDIIQFRAVERPIPTVHRIIEACREEEEELYFITQGDANNAPDEPVKSEMVVGKVVFTVPKAGWFTITVRELFR